MFMLQLPANLTEENLKACNINICNEKFDLGDGVYVDRPYYIPNPSIRLALWTTRNPTGDDVAALKPSPTYFMNFDKDMICILMESIPEMLISLDAAESLSFGGFVLNLGRMCYATIDRGFECVMFRRWWIRKEDEYKDLPLNPSVHGIHLNKTQLLEFVGVLETKLKQLVPELKDFGVKCDLVGGHSKACVVCVPKGKLPLQLTMEQLCSFSVQNIGN